MNEPEPTLGAGLPETVNRDGAFPRLDADQRRRLEALGIRRAVRAGDVLFAAGNVPRYFFIVESGMVMIVQGAGRENRVVAVHGHHRFLGELATLMGHRHLLSAVVRDPGEVIQVPVEKLRNVAAEDKSLSDVLLRAFILRRSILIEAAAGITVIGSRFSNDARRLREFLARNRIPHQWMDVEKDVGAETLLETLGVEPGQTPVVIRGDATILHNPTNSELGAALGLSSKGRLSELSDVIIVGSGPAGLSAALYAASEGLDVLTVEAVASGGQAGTSARIENYLGFPAGVSGGELSHRAGVQAAKFGARLTMPAVAIGLSSEPARHEIKLSTGQVTSARTVVIATGAQYRRLDVSRLDEFEGGGVYYAATQAEALRCDGDPIVVVGGGNSAGQAAMFLSEHASSCRLLTRGTDLRRSMSRYLVDQIERNDQIEVRTRSKVLGLGGKHELESIVIEDGRSGEQTELETRGLFVFIGASPHTDWLAGQLATDDAGFLLTGPDVHGDDLADWGDERPLFLETSRRGVFAAGDVRSGSIKRVASAVGEGSMAVQLIHRRLAQL